MLIESLHDLRLFYGRRLSKDVVLEADDFGAVVHAGDEQIMFATWRGMPFDAPCASTNVGLNEGTKRSADIENADGVVVTGEVASVSILCRRNGSPSYSPSNRYYVLNVWMTLDGRHTRLEAS